MLFFRIPEAKEIGERPFGRLTEDITRKRNQVAQGIYRQRCRSYKKDLDHAKNQIKAKTVDNILNHYSLLKEAETIENEKLDKNKKSDEHFLKRPEIPTISLRKSQDNDEDQMKSLRGAKTKTRLKRSATFVLGDLPSQSNIRKTSISKGQQKFAVTRSRTTLFKEMDEVSEKSKPKVKTTSIAGFRAHIVPRLYKSAPNPTSSKDRGKENSTDSPRHRPQTERSSTTNTSKGEDCEKSSVSKSTSDIEAEYFLKRINKLFKVSGPDGGDEEQTEPRPQSCIPCPQSKASSRTRSFLQNTVSKYKWVFIPGVTYYDLDKQCLSKQREREKVKVRQSELATIQADLHRKETSIRRLVRRSTNIREEMSHVTTGRPPR